MWKCWRLNRRRRYGEKKVLGLLCAYDFLISFVGLEALRLTEIEIEIQNDGVVEKTQFLKRLNGCLCFSITTTIEG